METQPNTAAPNEQAQGSASSSSAALSTLQTTTAHTEATTNPIQLLGDRTLQSSLSDESAPQPATGLTMTSQETRRLMQRYLMLNGSPSSSQQTDAHEGSISSFTHPQGSGHVAIQMDRNDEQTHDSASGGQEQQEPGQVPNPNQNPLQTQQIDEMGELRPYILWINQGFPFIFLMLSLFVYQHIQGLSMFVLLLLIFIKIDAHIRFQVSLKSDRSLRQCVSLLCLLCVTFVVIQLFSFAEKRFLFVFLGVQPHQDFFESLWVFVMNDFILTNVCMLIKVILIMAFGCRFPHRRNGQIYSCIEGGFRLIKLLAPIPIWSAYLSTNHTESAFAASISILYPILKIYDFGVRLTMYIIHIKKFIEDQHYGQYVRLDEIVEEERTCPICHDSEMTNPIALRCNHVFCEDCITQWFFPPIFDILQYVLPIPKALISSCWCLHLSLKAACVSFP